MNALLSLRMARRPLFVFGWGVRLAGAQDVAKRLLDLTTVPVVTTWGAVDMFPQSIGCFGTHGTRPANFAVQNADLLICVGTRLDTKATGSPASAFAPKAKILMVDIDPSELEKMWKLGRPIDGACLDAREFLEALLSDCVAYSSHDLNTGTWGYREWTQKIEDWKARYPVCLQEYEKESGINPYVFVRDLGKHINSDDVIVSDTGCSLGWMMQGYKFKGERFIHAFNQTPMGYGLPAAIGAAFATGKRVVLVTGDGGLSVNITELATVARHDLPIKIILFNNRGHAMCRQTQRQWLNGEYHSTSYEGGLACPNFTEVAKSYGIRAESHYVGNYPIWRYPVLLEKGFSFHGPYLLELPISEDHGIVPQAKLGHNLEDQEPLLSRDELAEVMA